MSDIEKAAFINLIVYTLKEHPDWFGDIVYAMQRGLAAALQSERRHAGDLASGFITLFQGDKHKRIVARYRDHLQGGLRALLKHYGGAAVEKEIAEFIDDDLPDR